MKSLQQFLEAQNFLVKGHTKDQANSTVDLGLSVKWATCNIGANKPEESGLLFQWGRTDGYEYNDKNHKFLTKKGYIPTSKTTYKKGDILKQEDDIAYQATNGKFRMPTKDEINELIEHTDNEWTELNGVKGRKFISKKDESKWIFIPAAGFFDCNEGSFFGAGKLCCVWSSYSTSSYDCHATFLYSNSNECDRWLGSSFDGQSVRGVLNK